MLYGQFLPLKEHLIVQTLPHTNVSFLDEWCLKLCLLWMITVGLMILNSSFSVFCNFASLPITYTFLKCVLKGFLCSSCYCAFLYLNLRRALITWVSHNACSNVLFTWQDFNQLPNFLLHVLPWNIACVYCLIWHCPLCLPAGCQQESWRWQTVLGDVFVCICASV